MAISMTEGDVPTGFIYVVNTVDRDYRQPSFMAVPTWFNERLYFGPCKVSMRPRMNAGDYIFGISPSKTSPRRVIFVAKIAEKLSFAEAYIRFPKLRGPNGPIHVRPAHRAGVEFAEINYEHIPGANHSGNWQNDVRTPALDAFFVCEAAHECLGNWLGSDGPPISNEILNFLRLCSVHGQAGLLSEKNLSATLKKPICHGGLYTGLHLETEAPEELAELVCKGRGHKTLKRSTDSHFTKNTEYSYSSKRRKIC